MPVRRAAGANDLFALARRGVTAQCVQLFGGYWPDLKWPLLKAPTPTHIEIDTVAGTARWSSMEGDEERLLASIE